MTTRPPMRFRAFALQCALAALAVACSDTSRSNLTFAFDRPEYVELVCIDVASNNGLPMACCAPTRNQEPTAELAPAFGQPTYLFPPGDTPLGRGCAGAKPELHALVTQSVRGEVAAVDLVTQRVIDSDQRIPGFTFVNVGGFPTAVVVPLERPTPGYDPETVEGPPWTYVSSAADNAVRAVATCRFRSREPCGPELDQENENALRPTSRAELFLPSTPSDMLFGPDEALWLSLPGQGVLARVQVAARSEDGSVPASDEETSAEQADPFLMGADPNVPAEPQYFRVPPPGSFEIEKPEELVSDAYTAICGLGYDPVLSAPLQPLAPRATPASGTPVSPARMRYDALSGLLFVSDMKLPVLHVFSLGADGTLTTRGSLPVGQPLKDFVLSPLVAAESPELFTGMSISDPAGPQTRYLYGLDTAGALLAFELTTSGTGASAVPLLAPVPHDFRDRLLMGSDSAVGAALEVIDTRPHSPENCGTVLGPDNSLVAISPQDTTSIVAQLQQRLERARTALSTAQKTGGDVAQATLERDRALRSLEIARNAGPLQLRGVFLIVISLAGEISVFDILDLDVPCRAETSCNPSAPSELLQGNQIQSGTTPAALPVQRNAPRLRLGQEPDIQVSSSSAFIPPTCDRDYVAADSPVVTVDEEQMVTSPLICVIADPWAERDQNWTIQTNGMIPGLQLQNGVFERRVENGEVIEDQLILRAPAGVSLCGRGAMGGVDDQVVVLGGAPSVLGGQCPQPATGNEPRLKVLQAHDDYLVLRALGLTNGNSEAVAELDDLLEGASPEVLEEREDARMRAKDEVDALLRCFPEFVTFEVRTGNSLARTPLATTVAELAVQPVYLVTGTVSGYLHRMVPGTDGICVEDPDKDPRYRARTKAGEVFENPQLRFILSAQAGAQVTILSSQGTTVLRETITTTDLPAARPASIRWFPYTNGLFIVDSATGGLRQMDLSPFRTNPDAIYR